VVRPGVEVRASGAAAQGSPAVARASAEVAAGWVRVDCHLHTVASGDAVTTLDQLAERVAHHSIDVIFITDHNETSAAEAATRQGIGARVIIGEEIRTPDGDVIGLFLAERIPYVLPLAEVTARIRAQGGLVYVPHPFDSERSSLGPVLPGLCANGDVDVVEVFNAKIADQALNDRAARLAAQFGLPGGAGSDAHDPEGIGAAFLEMPDFDGPASFLSALIGARVLGEYRPHAPRYAPRWGG
jgi:predicted metal-dependent phosphoesterase TrpH